jgi:hypothetical protein
MYKHLDSRETFDRTNRNCRTLSKVISLVRGCPLSSITLEGTSGDNVLTVHHQGSLKPRGSQPGAIDKELDMIYASFYLII